MSCRQPSSSAKLPHSDQQDQPHPVGGPTDSGCCRHQQIHPEDQLNPGSDGFHYEDALTRSYLMSPSCHNELQSQSSWGWASPLGWGLFLLVGACWFWWQIGGNPLNELALIRHGFTVPGFITDAWEDVNDDEYGRTHWSHSVTYRYRLRDGREFMGAVHGSGRLKRDVSYRDRPYSVEVEYLPEHPSVSRIKGAGCQTVMEWLWRRLGLGSLVLVLFCSPGLYLVQRGLRDLSRVLRAHRQPRPLREPTVPASATLFRPQQTSKGKQI